MLLDRGRLQPVGGFRRQQEMVDADAVVLLPGAGLVIPERIEFCGIRRCPDGLDQPDVLEAAERFAGARKEESVAGPDPRVMAVVGFGNDVVVAGKNERLFELQPVFRKELQALHPCKLVGILHRIVGRIAVRKVQAADANGAALDGVYAFDEPGLLVAVVTRQSAVDLVRRNLRK